MSSRKPTWDKGWSHLTESSARYARALKAFAGSKAKLFTAWLRVQELGFQHLPVVRSPTCARGVGGGAGHLRPSAPPGLHAGRRVVRLARGGARPPARRRLRGLPLGARAGQRLRREREP